MSVFCCFGFLIAHSKSCDHRDPRPEHLHFAATLLGGGAGKGSVSGTPLMGALWGESWPFCLNTLGFDESILPQWWLWSSHGDADLLLTAAKVLNGCTTGLVLHFSYVFCHFMTVSLHRYYSNFHFRNEETEAKRVYTLSRTIQNSDMDLIGPLIMPML